MWKVQKIPTRYRISTAAHEHSSRYSAMLRTESNPIQTAGDAANVGGQVLFKYRFVGRQARILKIKFDRWDGDWESGSRRRAKRSQTSQLNDLGLGGRRAAGMAQIVHEDSILCCTFACVLPTPSTSMPWRPAACQVTVYRPLRETGAISVGPP